MKCLLRSLYFTTVLFFILTTYAYANIAPVKINQDGVEPIVNPGVRIESADINVTPDNNSFIFNCKYVLKGLANLDNFTIGIPGDPGYTLEAGYIENINILVNNSIVKYKVYDTSKHLSESLKNYNSPLQFKWHCFSLPIKKDAITEITVNYTVSWRVFEQNKSSPYYIVPFLLSTDKLFGDNVGKYKITYTNDDNISLPDVKVMINSVMEPNIISPAILSPKWDDTHIIWEFNSFKDFQDFRLIVLSFRKIAMEFSTGTEMDNTIKWAMLNNNYDRLAGIFEGIAKKEIPSDIMSDELGTAAYLSAEFYYRIGNYMKALEMLSPSYKISLWPAAIKYKYLNTLNLKELKEYDLLLDELKKLSSYKDYILVSNYAEKEIIPITNIIVKQVYEKSRNAEANKEVVTKPDNNVKQQDNEWLIFLLSAVSLGFIYKVYRILKQKNF